MRDRRRQDRTGRDRCTTGCHKERRKECQPQRQRLLTLLSAGYRSLIDRGWRGDKNKREGKDLQVREEGETSEKQPEDYSVRERERWAGEDRQTARESGRGWRVQGQVKEMSNKVRQNGCRPPPPLCLISSGQRSANTLLITPRHLMSTDPTGQVHLLWTPYIPQSQGNHQNILDQVQPKCQGPALPIVIQ